jgi:hypothetical protein
MNKETIKQFLNPNKKKFLVFVILGMILLFSPIIHCTIYHGGGSLLDGGWSENSLCSPLRCILDSNIIFSIMPRLGGSSAVCSWNEICSIYILTYISSCLIIFVYDRFKTKKQ